MENEKHSTLYGDEEETFKQVVCEKCEFVGFGISENETYIYVVANYDKLYE